MRAPKSGVKFSERGTLSENIDAIFEGEYSRVCVRNGVSYVEPDLDTGRIVLSDEIRIHDFPLRAEGAGRFT